MQQELPKIILTEDGSSSLMHTTLNENYHSIHGALNESMHIFIQSGLMVVSSCAQTINILEVGFGTGLNALLTLNYANSEKIKINYTGFEPFPIDVNIAKQLNYPEIIEGSSKEAFIAMHESSENNTLNMGDYFLFQKQQVQIQNAVLKENSYKLVFFDAFSPEVQPEMWEEEVFGKVFKAIELNGILLTYCAKGQVKRTLKKCGFIIESIPGPKGKREITRARKPFC